MTIYEEHERLCEAADEHERRIAAYRDRLANECKALPVGWRWLTVTPVVVTATGDGDVSLHSNGALTLRCEGSRQYLPADLLSAMRAELDRARKSTGGAS